MSTLAFSPSWRYGLFVAANSAAGFGDPNYPRRTSAAPQTAGAFFVPAVRVYGGCAWETERSAGFQVPGSPTRVQPSPFLFGDRWRRLQLNLEQHPCKTLPTVRPHPPQKNWQAS